MKKKIIGLIICTLLITTILPLTGALYIGNKKTDAHISTRAGDANTISMNDENEYWALLVAVGVYANHSEENRPSMLIAVEAMYNMLLTSENWASDHIKIIKGEEATAINIVEGLLWLDEMDDKDDISLVYITTHGFPLSIDGVPIDIPPFDEKDGCDEALVTYWGFEYPLAIIWDDELNLLLSLLDSMGVCVIIDSCYSGGFNDSPLVNGIRRNTILSPKRDENKFTASDWMQGFAEDISGKGRVVLMSCSEDEVSYGSVFSHFLIEGLQGFADKNGDNACSAEEAFEYAKLKVENQMGGLMHPTIYDGFTGELLLTQV